MPGKQMLQSLWCFALLASLPWLAFGTPDGGGEKEGGACQVSGQKGDGACQAAGHSILQRKVAKQQDGTASQPMQEVLASLNLLHAELDEQHKQMDEQSKETKALHAALEEQGNETKDLERKLEAIGDASFSSFSAKQGFNNRILLSDDAGDSGPLPSWTLKQFHQLGIVDPSNCEAPEAHAIGHLQISGNASKSDESRSGEAEESDEVQESKAGCSSSQVILRRIWKNNVMTQCCPASSLACAGCVEYDARANRCKTCAEGFTKMSGTGPQCEACADVDGWVDPEGHSCRDYEKKGWCSLGAPTRQGSAGHKSRIEFYISKGLSPTTACCVCGGGQRESTPFSYPVSLSPLALGKSLPAIYPVPRTSTDYTVSGCNLHALNLTFESSTGTVQGVLSAREPTSVSCSVTAHDRKHGLQSSSVLKLNFLEIAYSDDVLIVQQGSSWQPKFVGNFSLFAVRCTPDVPWLQIEAATGLLTTSSKVNMPQPRLASCTVSAMKRWCPEDTGKPGNKTSTTTTSTPSKGKAASMATASNRSGNGSKLAIGSVDDVDETSSSNASLTGNKDCISEARQVEIAVMVPNEPSQIFLVHRDYAAKEVPYMMLTVGEDVPHYRFVPTLSTELFDPFGTFYIDCGTQSSFDRFSSTLRWDGYDVFSVIGGEVGGRPDSALMNFCTGKMPRCKLVLQCRAYNELPISKMLISVAFSVQIFDDTCWNQQVDTHWQQTKVVTQAKSLYSCRAWCRAEATCPAFAFPGKCVVARVASHLTSDIPLKTAVFTKASKCSIFKRCLNLEVAGAKYLSGQYCPDVVRDRGFPLFSKPGIIDPASIWLQKYVPELVWANPKPCDDSTKWVLRRHSKKDLVKASKDAKDKALVELYGDVLLCLTEDVIEWAYENSGLVGFKAKPKVLANDQSTGSLVVQPDVYDCPSPLKEREEYLQKLKLPNEFEDEDSAKKVFRFDDPATNLVDDFSMGPCECAPESYGEVFPVKEGILEGVPPGSGNQFAPPPQLLASGSLTCDSKSSKISYGTTEEQCLLDARASATPFYWFGEQIGEMSCRLFASCDNMVLEHQVEGQLFGLTFAQACAVANPEECWVAEKRRQFVSGYRSAVAPGVVGGSSSSEACLFEDALRACDSFRVAGILGIEECGLCLYKTSMVSFRLSLLTEFGSGMQLSLSCHPDNWRGMARGRNKPLAKSLLTCIDGSWVDEGGEASMSGFTCEAGVQVTSKEIGQSLLPMQDRGKQDQWWQHHFGLVLKKWDGKKCYTVKIDKHQVSMKVEFRDPDLTRGAKPRVLLLPEVGLEQRNDTTLHGAYDDSAFEHDPNPRPANPDSAAELDADSDAIDENVSDEMHADTEATENLSHEEDGEDNATDEEVTNPGIDARDMPDNESLLQTGAADKASDDSQSDERLGFWRRRRRARRRRRSHCHGQVENDDCWCQAWQSKGHTYRRRHGSGRRRSVCVDYAGYCSNGRLTSLRDRRQMDHCGECYGGYRLVGRDCKPWGGICANGNLKPQHERRKENDCSSCNSGYYMNHRGDAYCIAWGGSCSHGVLKYQTARKMNHDCGGCNNGYTLANNGPGHYCRPYAGSCSHGKLIQQTSRSGDDHCGSCTESYYLKPFGSIARCVACPCDNTHLTKCVCDSHNGFSWRGDVKPMYYTSVKVTIIAKLPVKAGCKLNEVPLTDTKFFKIVSSTAGATTYQQTKHFQISERNPYVMLRGSSEDDCANVVSISLSNSGQPGYFDCHNNPDDDAWLIEELLNAPGQALLKFLRTKECANDEGALVACSTGDAKQYVSLSMLPTIVGKWTPEHSESRHCDNSGKSCKCCRGRSACTPETCSYFSWRNYVAYSLHHVEGGSRVVGYPNKEFLQKVTLSSSSKRSGAYSYSYQTAAVTFDVKTCQTFKTVCRPDSVEVFVIESHQILCPSGFLLTSFSMETCSGGYQYSYGCCQVRGIGGCEAELTGWTEVQGNVLHGLSKQSVQCQPGHALRGFVLESKDPGKNKQEIRYDLECCIIPTVLPIVINHRLRPVRGTFRTFEGFYFPTGKQEGFIQMSQGFSYAQAAPIGLETMPVYSLLGTHRFNGRTCHDASKGKSADLPLAGDSYTIEAWIKPDKNYGNAGIVGWGTYSRRNTNAFRLGRNIIKNYWWDNDIQYRTANLADGKWHHVAATYDAKTKMRKLFVDFVKIKFSKTGGYETTSKSNFCVGRTGQNEYFSGEMKDLMIWKVARKVEDERRKVADAQPRGSGFSLFYEKFKGQWCLMENTKRNKASLIERGSSSDDQDVSREVMVLSHEHVSAQNSSVLDEDFIESESDEAVAEESDPVATVDSATAAEMSSNREAIEDESRELTAGIGVAYNLSHEEDSENEATDDAVTENNPEAEHTHDQTDLETDESGGEDYELSEGTYDEDKLIQEDLAESEGAPNEHVVEGLDVPAVELDSENEDDEHNVDTHDEDNLTDEDAVGSDTQTEGVHDAELLSDDGAGADATAAGDEDQEESGHEKGDEDNASDLQATHLESEAEGVHVREEQADIDQDGMDQPEDELPVVKRNDSHESLLQRTAMERLHEDAQESAEDNASDNSRSDEGLGFWRRRRRARRRRRSDCRGHGNDDCWCRAWQSKGHTYRRRHGSGRRRAVCVNYAGACSHGSLTGLHWRRQMDHCGSCNGGYYLSGRVCRPWGGHCWNGHLKHQHERRTHNECGSCVSGYYLHRRRRAPHPQTCNRFGGTCRNGKLKAPQNRVAEHDCGSCNNGYYLSGRVCMAWGGGCPNGRLAPQHARRAHDHCISCENGYYLNRRRRAHTQSCNPWGGTCLNGKLAAQKNRRAENHCSSCKNGYYLSGLACKAWGGSCPNGKLAAQDARRAENHCSSCNNGYYLSGRACKAWGGACLNGRLAPQHARRANNHCNSCNGGYYLSGHACKAWGGRCSNGKLKPQHARRAHDDCAGCNGGYYLSQQKIGTCLPYGGKCAHGLLITQSQRRQPDHCGSCENGYTLLERYCAFMYCTSSSAPHPLQVGDGGVFDVSSVRIMEAKEGAGLKSIKVVKFKGPPKLEEVKLKKRSLEAFKPSRALAAFDMSTVQEWMPSSPTYKPYCALRNPKDWKEEADMSAEAESGWGVIKRNQNAELNSEEGAKLIQEAGESGHPCKNYLLDPSPGLRPIWATDFNFGKYLMNNLISKAKKKATEKATEVVEKNVPKEMIEKAKKAKATYDEGQELFGEEAGEDEKSEPTGLTMDVEEECANRKNERDRVFALDTKSNAKVVFATDLASTASHALCAAIPNAGVVMAPLGGGASTSWNLGTVCRSIADAAVQGIQTYKNQYTLARESWKMENDMADNCDPEPSMDPIDKVQGHLYKVFCDLHCIEDAVVNGNHAILKSMHTLSKHLLSTVQQMMHFYTNEIFEKIKETQTQINHNDKQSVDILTDYVGQIMSQNTKYTKHLNKAIGRNIIPPLNKLQKDIATVNANLIKAHKLLETEAVVEPRALLWQQQESEENLHPLSRPYHLAGEATIDLMRALHGRAGLKQIGFNEDAAIPVMLKATRIAHYHAGKAAKAFVHGNVSSAHTHVLEVAGELRRAGAALAKRGHSEATAETFARRTLIGLQPAGSGLSKRAYTAMLATSSLASMQQGQLALMGHVNSLQQLSDQIEQTAAADMLVKFDSEVVNVHRAFADYVHSSIGFLQLQAGALETLRHSSQTAGCQSPERIRQVGVQLAALDRARKKHLLALSQSWQVCSDSLLRLTNLLADGGLLVHYVWLTSRGVSLEDTAGKNGSLAVRFASTENHMQQALKNDMGKFVLQVRRAFSISQHLIDMWDGAEKGPPAAEVANLRGAWAKVSLAARGLRESLQTDGQLRTNLVLSVLERAHGKLSMRFPPPGACAKASEGHDAALWSDVKEGQKAALLLTRAGRWLQCDPVSGKLSTARRSKDSSSEDMGAFLADLM
eukprot:TRINITY_DN15999_c0_g1_i1.p1 TRINITY_DN15999_c0_g1~~TRINITY_DN15999_c0_g1_i1.p1  ORF type:complete len:3926 (-),score=687.33 TRINITY_DN15999_c0_g1_i1:334-12111(-)